MKLCVSHLWITSKGAGVPIFLEDVQVLEPKLSSPSEQEHVEPVHRDMYDAVLSPRVTDTSENDDEQSNASTNV